MRLLRVPVFLFVAIVLGPSAGFAAEVQNDRDQVVARTFLQSIYRHYEHHGHGIDFTGKHARAYFTASFVALMEADEKAAGPDEVSVVGDGDPFCGCQDWAGIWNLKIALEPEGPARIRAKVSFALFAPKAGEPADVRSLEFALVKERAGWRIDNAIDQSDPKNVFDLRAAMQKEITELGKKK